MRWAGRERESDRFTEYDGCVPEAGKDMDPSGPEGRALSASALEKLAKCPLWFFFEYVLDVEPPEEYADDDTVWLGPSERGGLLHSVFREFMAAVAKEERIPEHPRDRDLMKSILDRHVAEKKKEMPPP